MALPRPAPAAGPAADVPGSATSPPRAATGRGCSSPSPARRRPAPTPEPGPTPRRPRPGAASPPPTSQPPLAPTSRPRTPRPPTGKSATSSTCWTGPRTGRTAAPPTPRRSPPSAASRPPPPSWRWARGGAAVPAATEGLDVEREIATVAESTGLDESLLRTAVVDALDPDTEPLGRLRARDRRDDLDRGQ